MVIECEAGFRSGGFLVAPGLPEPSLFSRCCSDLDIDGAADFILTSKARVAWKSLQDVQVSNDERKP